jgi:hypothetical protein
VFLEKRLQLYKNKLQIVPYSEEIKDISLEIFFSFIVGYPYQIDQVKWMKISFHLLFPVVHGPTNNAELVYT